MAIYFLFLAAVKTRECSSCMHSYPCSLYVEPPFINNELSHKVNLYFTATFSTLFTHTCCSYTSHQQIHINFLKTQEY